MIRKATPNDIEQILEIYAILFSEMSNLQPQYWCKAQQNKEFIQEIITSPSAAIFVSEEDSQILGLATVKEQITPPYPCITPHRYAYLMDIAVFPQYRNTGVGTDLINTVKDWAISRNLDYLELNVLEENTQAIKLYEKHQFKTKLRNMKYPLK